jgi:hypothetical protein
MAAPRFFIMDMGWTGLILGLPVGFTGILVLGFGGVAVLGGHVLVSVVLFSLGLLTIAGAHRLIGPPSPGT